jgi:hypothetical protein
MKKYFFSLTVWERKKDETFSFCETFLELHEFYFDGVLGVIWSRIFNPSPIFI